jgi:hypothetical protein
VRTSRRLGLDTDETKCVAFELLRLCKMFFILFRLASMLGERPPQAGLFSTEAVFEQAYGEPIPIRSAIGQLVSTVMVKEGT